MPRVIPSFTRRVEDRLPASGKAVACLMLLTIVVPSDPAQGQGKH